MREGKKPAILLLENGSCYSGTSFGHEKEALGEVCFNTSHSGYQEILTDPSYYKQIIILTYPMIGNYGIDPDVNESGKIHASGLIVKEYVKKPSNFTSRMSLGQFLSEHMVPGLEGIDTRKLVLEIRNQGAMRGGIFPTENFTPDLLEKVRAFPRMKGSNLASFVSTNKKYSFGEIEGKKYNVAVLDFGVKSSILRSLTDAGFAVEVFPAATPTAELLSEKHDCFLISNGPGDPEPLRDGIDRVRIIIDSGRPIFGICLGHQLIGLARNLVSFKLKFGHRGGNQPVKNIKSGRVEITSQNHGFAIADPDREAVALTHVNLNDKTVEGYTIDNKNVMSVQYHPEASPGPHDSTYLFREFYEMVERYYSR